MTTTKDTERTEHVAVTEARAHLARLRRELAEVEAAAALIPRGDIVAMHPIVKKKTALEEEQRAAEQTLRELWTKYEGASIVAAGYGAVIDATEEYITSVTAMHTARARAVEARARFNDRLQASRKGVPRESDWSLNDAPPAIPIPELSDRDFATWAARVRREFQSWATSWGA